LAPLVENLTPHPYFPYFINKSTLVGEINSDN